MKVDKTSFSFIPGHRKSNGRPKKEFPVKRHMMHRINLAYRNTPIWDLFIKSKTIFIILVSQRQNSDI